MSQTYASFQIEGQSRHEDPVFAIASEGLKTEIKMRMGRLITDLANDDLSMAFLDLAQLHRTLTALDPNHLAQVRRACAEGMFTLS